jgi:23S rRNA pseudouridine1911/1915/1917 synthase
MVEQSCITNDLQVLYEDNHLLVVNKRAGELVQSDLSGDISLEQRAKQYIKEKYRKVGNVFLGVPHRLDRPVSGVVVLAKTSKSLARLNEMFKRGEMHKKYLAIVVNRPHKEEDLLVHYLVRNEKQNKSYAHLLPVVHSKEACLRYKLVGEGERYFLLEIELLTGRHHQIRCQLSAIGCPIKGDLKYGAPRSNPSGSISLHAQSVAFVHPVGGRAIFVAAPTMGDVFGKISCNRGCTT